VRENVNPNDTNQYETFDYEGFEQNLSGESEDGSDEISPSDKRLKMA
jgi:hypothetical protein